MNEREQINSFRGLGYDHIVDQGLSKGLSVGDIAINILDVIPTSNIEKQKAINLLVEAGSNIINNNCENARREETLNVSDQQQAVNLLVSAAETIRGSKR